MESMEYSSGCTYSQKILRSIYYSAIPPPPIPKNYQKECSLKLKLGYNYSVRSITPILLYWC